jgi:hypothetical protein
MAPIERIDKTGTLKAIIKNRISTKNVNCLYNNQLLSSLPQNNNNNNSQSQNLLTIDIDSSEQKAFETYISLFH